MLKFQALKFCLYLILSAQADLTAQLTLLHMSGDCSKPQGAGFRFWQQAHRANMVALEWLMNQGDIWNLVYSHYYS